MDGPEKNKLFKVRLKSGRILGPLDSERVRLLIAKGHINGSESAREYPNGDWVDASQIPEIARLLIKYAQGEVVTNAAEKKDALSSNTFPGRIPTHMIGAKTVPIAPSKSVVVATVSANLPSGEAESPDDDDEKTMIGVLDQDDLGADLVDEVKEESEATQVAVQPRIGELEISGDSSAEPEPLPLSQEPTIVLSRLEITRAPLPSRGDSFRDSTLRQKMIATVAAVFLGITLYDLVFDQEANKAKLKAEPVRASMPDPNPGKPNPKQSAEKYDEGRRDFNQDHVLGYRKAVSHFRRALTADPNNAQAYAMLALSYISLLDSSNKDEKYFQTISALIELARAQAKDILETVMADVEFFIVANKPEAAYQRMIEYTKDHAEYGPEHFYYMALVLHHRGDNAGAARMIANIPDDKVSTPRIFYLRGKIAEKLNAPDAAIREYEKAVRLSSDHAKSRLRIADIFSQMGRIKEAAQHIDFIVANGELLDPVDQARGYYLRSQLFQISEQWNEALGAIDSAVALDSGNADYVLERYTLLTKVGDSVEKVQGQARMYYFLSEGQKAAKAGAYEDANKYFLQARQANDKSPLPLMRMGDMFRNLGDVSNAKDFYEKAAKLAPHKADIWSKYIFGLIQCYEFEEAKKAIDKLRALKVGESVIDKTTGDLLAKQGLHREAQGFYQKAMSRESIDSEVYIAYADSLLETKNFQEAPFFFALARRFDPLNVQALIGTAKAVAASDGAERAITLIQDELQKGNSHRAELLSAIAEFQIQRGEWEAAQQFVNQAREAAPNYAQPWKVQGMIYLNQEHTHRGALNKALEAFQSFSDRNPSDPSGYLERYKIFIKKADLERADLELTKIYGVFPRYPGLHYYRGALFSIMGNHQLSVQEFEKELTHDARSYRTIVALGKEYIELRRVAEALKKFNDAGLLAPDLAEPKHWAGYSNFLLKNYEGAILLYQESIRRDPGNPLTYKRMGQAYRAMNRPAEAKKAFQKYLQMEPDASDRAEFERFL